MVCAMGYNELTNLLLITHKQNSRTYNEVPRDEFLDFVEPTVGWLHAHILAR